MLFECKNLAEKISNRTAEYRINIAFVAYDWCSKFFHSVINKLSKNNNYNACKYYIKY